MIDSLNVPDEDSPYPFASFKKVLGRKSDIILLPNGKRFHPVNIFGGTLFRRFPAISRHKVIWNGVSLKFVFERNGPLDEEKLNAELQESLASYDVPFTIEYTSRLVVPAGGKHTYLEIEAKRTGN
jgi:CRISPR/Cas system CMR-associated protein Cmr1 (group 7 of RAMP superfamily)